MDNTYIKSPFNYIGGKHRLLPQLLDKFPKKISMLYDVFGGGGSVSLNVCAEHIYYNDIVNYVSDMFKELQYETKESSLVKIHNIINKYELSKTNLDGFLQLRKDYNDGHKSWEVFYVLTCYSFNFQYRFNSNHDYNSSFGKHRSSYTQTTEEKLILFIDRLHDIDIVFDCKDFRKIDFSDANKNDLVYFDPPYLITTGNYNDGKRGFSGWCEQDDIDLYTLCDGLDKQGTRFALNNVFESKGKSNDGLKKWASNYNVTIFNNDYSNCNYQAKDKSKGNTIEVLVTNY